MGRVDEILKNLSLDEMIGQLLCFNWGALVEKGDFEKIEELTEKTKAGGFYTFNCGSPENIKKALKCMEKYTKIPTIVAGDMENGPGGFYSDDGLIPDPMAWGACDDPDLVEKAHIATAEIARKLGIHWSFSPVVDINFNCNNPVTNIRAISDSPKQVAKMAVAAVRGMQRNGLMAAGCKHFPGDGMDDRNQHFCTTINSLSKEEWMNTYGYVYKELFKEGASTVMVGHIALPAYDEKLNDWVGYPPGSISYNIQTKLLKGELGFEGCIVSDALSMIGVNAAIHPDRSAVEFIKAGGDIILFPLVEDAQRIKDAVLSGEISMERIQDAVTRVLKLKEKVRLFEDQEVVEKDITNNYNLNEIADKIAEKSITVVRNYGDKLPLDLKKGDKVLLINVQKAGAIPSMLHRELTTVAEEFEKRGIKTVSFTNPKREDVMDEIGDAAAVFVNLNVCCRNFTGGSLRIGWEHIHYLWRGSILRHPNCIFTSFGDPYKLHDIPFAKNYLNVYSSVMPSQRAFVKAILGEIPIQGKNPVSHKGYFEAEV